MTKKHPKDHDQDSMFKTKTLKNQSWDVSRPWLKSQEPQL